MAQVAWAQGARRSHEGGREHVGGLHRGQRAGLIAGQHFQGESDRRHAQSPQVMGFRFDPGSCLGRNAPDIQHLIEREQVLAATVDLHFFHRLDAGADAHGLERTGVESQHPIASAGGEAGALTGQSLAFRQQGA
jgi:hypothetical protein